MIVHLVARTRLGVKVFADPERAFALWGYLKRRYGRASSRQDSALVVAACIMPNHLHFMQATRDAEHARRALATALSAFSRSSRLGRLWLPLPAAEEVPDKKHLLRQIRYVHLNPCRDGLVDDPLLWPWSTHRGVLGAEHDPLIDDERLAELLGRNARGFRDWFHRYVSSDPTAKVEGTPAPTIAPRQVDGSAALPVILDAARAAAPLPSQRMLRKRLVALLHRDDGGRNSAAVARALGISARQVRRLATRSDPRLLRVGRLLLSDARLRHVPGRGAKP